MAERMSTNELNELILETKRELQEAKNKLSRATQELVRRLEEEDGRRSL